MEQPYTTTPPETSEMPVKRFWNKRTIIIAAVLAALVIAGLAYYIYAGSANNDPQKAAQKEAQDLVSAVGKLIVLPSDELPIVATVADPSKLQNEQFFSNAKKGDKVLIYNNARKAILYDPVSKLVVDVAPLRTNPTPTPKVK